MLQVTITVLDDGTVKFDENITGKCMVSHFGIMSQALMAHAVELTTVCAINVAQNNIPLLLCQADLISGMAEYAGSRKKKIDEELEKVQQAQKQQQLQQQLDGTKAEDAQPVNVSLPEGSDPNGGGSNVSS